MGVHHIQMFLHPMDHTVEIPANALAEMHWVEARVQQFAPCNFTFVVTIFLLRFIRGSVFLFVYPVEDFIGKISDALAYNHRLEHTNIVIVISPEGGFLVILSNRSCPLPRFAFQSFEHCYAFWHNVRKSSRYPAVSLQLPCEIRSDNLDHGCSYMISQCPDPFKVRALNSAGVHLPHLRHRRVLHTMKILD
jgi:hypothetical protein